VEIVRDFCCWAEDNYSSDEDMKELLALLSSLYLRALALPEYESDDDIIQERLSHDEWKKMYDRFKLLPVGHYPVFFNPLDAGEEPVTADLADDLADIYRDLKAGLLLFEKGNIAGAHWEWRDSFVTHWGQHTLGAMYAIHHYIVMNRTD